MTNEQIQQGMISDDSDRISQNEASKLLADLKPIKHNDCQVWVDEGQCVLCLVKAYQQDVVQALTEEELKRSDSGDIMILGGTFAPWSPTSRMRRVLGYRHLESIRNSLKIELDPIDIDDGCIQRAIRHKINDDEDEAFGELRLLENRRLRLLFEKL
ncbi:hypothetical protein BGZ49_005433 [Haplosporangium sp. Z 27]|nr:hypothetical protein BGZ49_005433 [Haplosporangium sp. Z 27]